MWFLQVYYLKPFQDTHLKLFCLSPPSQGNNPKPPASTVMLHTWILQAKRLKTYLNHLEKRNHA